MKTFIFTLCCSILCISANAQGSKFKAVNRTASDSVAGLFTKGAQVIDASANPQLRSDNPLNPYLSAIQLPQLPDSIKKDPTSAVILKPAEKKPVVIERKRSQLRSAQMMSNEEITYTFFKETPSLNINRPEEQIRINRIDTDNLGMSHVKGVQLFRNIPVYGMDFTFHISSQNELFMGYTLNPASIDTVSARLKAEEAIHIAENDLNQTREIKPLNNFMKKMLKYERPVATSLYYPDKFNIYRISYKVIIRPNFKDEWIYYIDAQNGAIIEKYNNTPSAGPTKGTGIDLNNVQRTVDTYEENGLHYMVNTTKPMFNAANFTGTIIIYDAHNNPDIYTSNSTASTAAANSAQWNNPHAISAAYHASLTYDYIKNTFNRNSIDDKGMDMFCVVNMPDQNGQDFDNAFWNTAGAYFGNGQTDCYPLAGGLDCVAHEFGHGVVQHTANLEYKNQSGAINEGYADIFGAMVDRTNWTIGEKIMKNRMNYPTGYMRDMSNPHNGGQQLWEGGWQPAHVSEMYLGQEDNGGVHINSGIPNHAYYLYATSASKEKAEQIFYRALSNYLTPTSKFVDLRIAVLQATKDLYGDADVQLMANAFDRVGISDDTGSGKPTDLPTNPGQQGLLLTNLDTRDPYGLYKTTNYSSFTPLTTSKMYSKPSVTDDGKYVFFVNSSNVIRTLDITTGQERAVSNDAGYANVAISRDGNRMAFVTTQQDAKIYVYDFVSQQMSAFQLYNPTTGTDGAQSGGVQFAEAIEFDHTGEYILYDAYNIVGGSLSGEPVDYWDIGMLHVWNNNGNSFGSGQIAKLFSMLEPGVNIGNPTFSKNSPYIIAFDYMNKNQEYATFGMNLSTGDLKIMFTNSTTSFPSYSVDDKTMAFASFNAAPFAGYVALGDDKISIAGQAALIANYATFPIFYGTGARQLGVKPSAAFSADVRSGGAPLEVQYLDLSDNKPNRWSWEFEGGVPVVAATQNPVVYYNNPGTYKVKLTVYNDYGNDFVEKQSYITVGTSGIQDTPKETISVYPNPAKDYVWVQGTGHKVQDVKVLDVAGKVIPVSFANENDEIKIDISKLNAGIYVLQINTQQGVISRKIMKN